MLKKNLRVVSSKKEADSSRTEITPQEAILNDEIQMKDIKENLQKLQCGSQMQSIRDDLNNKTFLAKNQVKRCTGWEMWN